MKKALFLLLGWLVLSGCPSTPTPKPKPQKIPPKKIPSLAADQVALQDLLVKLDDKNKRSGVTAEIRKILTRHPKVFSVVQEDFKKTENLDKKQIYLVLEWFFSDHFGANSLIFQALAGDDQKLRKKAEKMLSDTSEKSNDLLIQGLKSPNEELRYRIVLVIHRLSPLPPQIERDLLSTALGEKNPKIQEKMVVLLGKRPSPKTQQLFLELLDKSSAEKVRLQAVRQIIETPQMNLTILKALKKSFVSEISPLVRVYIAYGLAKVGEKKKESIAYLQWALKNKDRELCLAALWAVAKLGDKVFLKGLFVALKHPDDGVRSETARCLGSLEFTGGEVNNVASVLLVALQDKSPFVRRAVALALNNLGAMGVESLLTSFPSLSLAGKKMVLFELSQVKNPHRRIIQTFVDGLGDKNPDLALSYRVALAKMGTPAIPFLLKRSGDKNPQMRRNIIRLLGLMEMKSSQMAQAFSVLIQRLGDPVLLVRLEAIGALTRFGTILEPLLCDSFKSNNIWVREGVLKVLSALKLKTSRAVSCLIKGLGDSSPLVVEEAVDGLLNLGKKAFPLLKSAIKKSENWKVRRGALRVIGKMAKQATAIVPVVLAAQKDSNLMVRFEARWTLRKLKKAGVYKPAKKQPAKKQPMKKQPAKKQPAKKQPMKKQPAKKQPAK